MSSLNSIISQINSLSGYHIPTGSSVSYAISASVPLTSGSVNDIVSQINTLTGYNIPATSVTFVSGSNVAGQPTVIYVPTAATGTIPTTGIYPGAIIKADHVLRIINALNGVSAYDIIMAGNLYVSGSSTMAQNLDLPFIPDQDLLYSSGGFTTGTNTVDGGSF